MDYSLWISMGVITVTMTPDQLRTFRLCIRMTPERFHRLMGMVNMPTVQALEAGLEPIPDWLQGRLEAVKREFDAGRRPPDLPPHDPRRRVSWREVRRLRLAMGLSQKELGLILGYSAPRAAIQVSGMEAMNDGTIHPPAGQLIKLLAIVFLSEKQRQEVADALLE